MDCHWADQVPSTQVADLPGALPALLGLVSGWGADAAGRPAEARARAEVVAAAARCVAQLSVHERLRLRLVDAGAPSVVAAAALQAGSDGDAAQKCLDKHSDPADGAGSASSAPAAASAAAEAGVQGRTPWQRTPRAPKPPPDRALAAAACALQRGAAAALANLCGDAALAERVGDETVVRALAALAALPDRDVQVSIDLRQVLIATQRAAPMGCAGRAR